MKKSVVIKSSSLPTRSPLLFAIVMWLLADRIGAPGWTYGVLWTFVALWAIVFVVGLFSTTFRDVPGFGEK